MKVGMVSSFQGTKMFNLELEKIVKNEKKYDFYFSFDVDFSQEKGELILRDLNFDILDMEFNDFIDRGRTFFANFSFRKNTLDGPVYEITTPKPDPIELTIEEIEKKYGRKVKIISKEEKE